MEENTVFRPTNIEDHHKGTGWTLSCALTSLNVCKICKLMRNGELCACDCTEFNPWLEFWRGVENFLTKSGWASKNTQVFMFADLFVARNGRASSEERLEVWSWSFVTVNVNVGHPQLPTWPASSKAHWPGCELRCTPRCCEVARSGHCQCRWLESALPLVSSVAMLLLCFSFQIHPHFKT